MLKYVSKIAMDILPSVVATIIGAYIVNHYIVARPAADAAGGGCGSSAEPKKADREGRFRSRPRHPPSLGNLPEPGVRAKGISEKAHAREDRRRKAGRVAEKPSTVESRREVRRQAGGDREHSCRSAPRTSAAPARKDGRQEVRRPRGRAAAVATPAVVAAPNTAPPVEAAIAAEDRDANDLARAAIERLRGTTRLRRARRKLPASGSAPCRRARRCQHPPRGRCQPVRPLPPPIMVSTPPADRFDAAPGSSRSRPTRPQRRRDDPHRPTPPADIPDRAAAARSAGRGGGCRRAANTPRSPKTCCRRRNRCFTRSCRSSPDSSSRPFRIDVLGLRSSRRYR